MPFHLHVGGLVAAGFDPSGKYLLTISHAGRGLFAVGTWERIARDATLAYPDNGYAVGIGPIEGLRISITEKNYKSEDLHFDSPDGAFHFEYCSGTITITDARA
jgi:hypothetical protein